MTHASGCTILSQNSSAEVSTKIATKCIEFRGINYDKTYFSADTSFQQNAAYTFEVKDATGRSLVKKQQTATGSSTHLKLNTYHTTLRVYLKPVTQDTHYEFFVVHDENTITNETVLYIGLNSKYEKPEVDREPCEGCWINNMPIDSPSGEVVQAQNQFNIMSSSSGSDLPQCTDANRSPDATPKDRATKEELNINSVLRVSKRWAEGVKRTHSTVTMYAASLARMISMHKIGGALDVAHGIQRKYIGSASMGNFLYGANSRAMGLPEGVIIRGAAAHQAISDNNGIWDYRSISQGIVNYIKNEGDNPGDREQTIRGIRYHDEVFLKNINDSRSVSCIDLESKESGSHGTPGSGGSEGGSSDGRTGGSSGSIVIVGSGGGGGSRMCFIPDNPEHPPFCWIE